MVISTNNEKGNHMALSPMMQQYNNIKKEYEDCLLMFRLGDFYELFFDDALIASKELELTLTGRNCGLEEKAPMCGVPFHSADSYISGLVRAGYKVAICEQVEDPKEAKGIVERAVTRVYTPGTLDISLSEDSGDSIYVASIHVSSKRTAIAYADISTGEFFVTDFEDNQQLDELSSQLSRYSPREILITEALKGRICSKIEHQLSGFFVNIVDSSYYKADTCEKILLSHFGMSSLIPLGLDASDEMVCASGSLLMFLRETQKQAPAQIKDIKINRTDDTMIIDRSTMRNLELLETIYDHETKGSLLGVLNRTGTAMGQRLLKKFIREPLKDSRRINLRLDAVEELMTFREHLRDLKDSFKHIYDFERLSARIASGRANARDLAALRQTLFELPAIASILGDFKTELLHDICSSIDDFEELNEMLQSAIVDEPNFVISEGGIIREGWSLELDELKASIKDAKLWIAGLEQTERERTGIKTIKVGYNKVFGYYIDVSKGMIDKVPEHYIRKQTLVNNERYITPELKEKETLVMNAETKINKLEYELFTAVRQQLEPHIESLQRASAQIALLDVLCSLATVAYDNGYVRPVVDDSEILDIRKGRHPAVESIIGKGMFVPNDTLINTGDRSLLMITGPNMAGKSTYMRQTAIIVLMAQLGSFVPADYARIGVVDRVLTRIGASDNLSYGQSTFFIEMSELAQILRNSTSKSLIILDEIGRGTSTFDGLSIAWATAEYLAEEGRHTRTMFATHYHELTELADMHESIHNLSVKVAEDRNDIVFLHDIADGPASKSYGIHVAKLAGVPKVIRTAASRKLRELESQALTLSGGLQRQLSLFETELLNDYDCADEDEAGARNENASELKELAERLAEADVNNLTPIEALNLLSKLSSDAKERLGDL